MGTTQAESVGAPLPEQATGPALVGDRSAIGTGCGSGPSGVTASGAARSVPPITVLALAPSRRRPAGTLPLLNSLPTATPRPTGCALGEGERRTGQPADDRAGFLPWRRT